MSILGDKRSWDASNSLNLLEEDDDDVQMSNRFLNPKTADPADPADPGPQTSPARQTPLPPHTIRLAPIQATSTSGTPISFGRKKKIDGTSTMNDVEPRSSYLAKPVHKLLSELDAKASTSTSISSTHSQNPSEAQLWTDKYKPNKFTDLMGDDRLNRQVMSWLKEWDRCVFNKTTADSTYKRKRDAEPYAYRDPHNLGRPQERLLLLSGPPGLGKTTLAYIIAKHAGYRVFEVNASDDRSARTVDDKLKSALDVNPITFDGTVDKRPTLVLVDEIDGATGEGSGGFVRQLINLATDYVPKKRKNGTTQPRLLLRPIICICNDLYTPSLRSLRPISRIVRYKPPSTLATVTRLKDICNEENIQTDTKSLNMLAESSGGDIRNCLNTLQFIQHNSMQLQTAIQINTKDSSRSVASVIQQIFKLEKSKTPSIKPAIDTMVECGEYDKISQSCYESYLKARVNDSRWDRYLTAIDALVDADTRNGLGDTYTPYHLSKLHLQFANINNGHIGVAGSTDYDKYVERLNNADMAKSFKLSLPHSLYRCYDLNTLVIELCPLLMQILAINLKLTNAQVSTEGDRRRMERAVQICVDLGVELKIDRDEDNKTLIKMDPAIDVLSQLYSNTSLSTFSTKQLLSKEINSEKVRRKTEKVKREKKSLSDKYGAPPTADAAAVNDASPTDFFGRELTTAKADILNKASTSTSIPPHYKYFEGFSNAVRKPIKMSQLL
ncbi:hypothetical protein E3P98_02175 [Wallemia ichthyophaga]|nr:hypothetical protein E3P98_02175 [Wallemia ichthyophaga]